MTTMKERIARALEWRCETPGKTMPPYHVLAEAVLAEMRVPTKPMLAATEDVVVGYDDFACEDGTLFMSHAGYEFESEGQKIVSDGYYETAVTAWQAMIDAAINEEPQ